MQSRLAFGMLIDTFIVRSFWVLAFTLVGWRSATANRTALHTSDRQRWQQFLLQAHREASPRDPAFLEGWLASEGWTEAARSELTRDYENTRQLLWSYDEEQRR